MFPLMEHCRRKSPCDFIPTIEDETGRGSHVWNIMSKLKITQGKFSGATLGDIAPDWQRKWVTALYGSTDPRGNPVYDEAFLYIAKKQGKSTISGMLAIAHTLAFPASRGSCIILADTKEQAQLVYDAMASTVEADSFLLSQFHVRRYRSDVVHKNTGTVMKAIACEMSATVGTQPTLYIVDELHLIGRKPNGAALVKQLSSGTAIHEHAMGIYITTAPIGNATGIFKSMYDRAVRISTGETKNDRMLPVLFELPPNTDPDNQAFWWMANPSLGRTISMDWLRREHQLAKDDPDESSLSHFLSQHLNIHAQDVMGVDRWVPISVWDRCADPGITLETLLDWSEAVYLGIDAGGSDDMTAIVVVGENAGQYQVWSHQWVHRDGYERRKNQSPLDEAVAAGELTVFDVAGQDLADMRELIIDKIAKYKMSGIGYDAYKLVTFAKSLDEELPCIVKPVPQGWKLSPHIMYTDRFLHEGKIKHSGKPLLRFNMQNAQIRERGQAVALSKPAGVGRSGKIDGAVCMVNAFAVQSENVTVDVSAWIG